MPETNVQQQAPTLVGALPPAFRDLLAAVVAALDVPLADRPVDDQLRAELLTRRAADTRVVVELLLAHSDIDRAAARLREWTAEHLVTYPTWQARTEQAAAEEEQLLAEAGAGFATSVGGVANAELNASPSTGGSVRCPAAHPEDPHPCAGPVVVTVLDRTNAGADGCEHHGARLLASLDRGRVYPLPDAPEGAAIRVFKAAAGIRPFPWVDGPRTRDDQLSLDEIRARGEHR